MCPKRTGLNGEDRSRRARESDSKAGKEIRIRLRVPRFRPPMGTGLVGAGSLSGMLVQGGIPADSQLVWPLVTLALGGMAHDVAVQALRRRDERCAP